MDNKKIETSIENLISKAMIVERMKIEPERYRQYAKEKLADAKEELLTAIDKELQEQKNDTTHSSLPYHYQPLWTGQTPI